MEADKLPKFCVFCGKKPENKNKEHIIPQWLIKLTGDPNRKINLGVDFTAFRKNGEFKLREFLLHHSNFLLVQHVMESILI